jgi:hypothetical protein
LFQVSTTKGVVVGGEVVWREGEKTQETFLSCYVLVETQLHDQLRVASIFAFVMLLSSELLEDVP